MDSSLPLQSWDFANANGMTMKVTNLGGKVMALRVPDKNGNLIDVVLGYDSIAPYINGNPYFGALIGRYGNRIANGKFMLGTNEFTLAQNNGQNALHGGPMGFHNVAWEGEPFQNDGNDALQLTYASADGEEGYPGELRVKVVYTLTQANEVVIDYEATTSQPTVVNLTHHSFFNLEGEGAGDILSHALEIFAPHFTPVAEGLIPTGELKPVTNTPFDFTAPHTIGERIDASEAQLFFGKGYDHNFVLTKPQPYALTLAARVHAPLSGIVMEVLTTEPGLQFYSGNFLDGSDKGKDGKRYGYRSAFCLEAQHFPDSPNQPHFPSTQLNPGQVYRQKTIYKFSTK